MKKTGARKRILSLDVGHRTGLVVTALLIIAAGGAALQLVDEVAFDIPADTVLAFMGVVTLACLVMIGVMFLRLHREARARATELAGAGAALRETEQRFRRIFEDSPVGIVLAQPETQRIVQVNPAFCRMVGYRDDELIDRTVTEITHVDDRDLPLNTGHDPNGPWQFVEKRFVTRSGAAAWCRVRMTLLSTSDKSEPLLLALAENITKRKRAEAELRQAQKMDAIGQLTGGIAHDFNNLLGVIIGNAEFLHDVVQEDLDHTALVDEILHSALNGADLTRRLLAFARRQPLQPRRIDLNEYLPNHIAILRRALGETVTVATKLADDLWPTRADPSQVGDALLNLAINARDAMPHGGSILIETANAHLDQEYAAQNSEVSAGDYVALSVTDTGIGMSPELLERAMEPFFTTKGPGVGSGLGLSMIYGFAQQSGGHLKIESKVGFGTTVRLYLPRVRGEEAEPAVAQAVAPLPGGKEAVLLVDDSVEMRMVARRHLTALGYRVAEAENGPAALAILQTGGRFDLLFTDIVMPDGMTGYQLAAAAQQLCPGLKILFTTGYDGTVWRDQAAPPYQGSMLRKPYRKQELANRVRAALSA